MENEISQLWLFFRWMAGLCFTGFLFLAGWIWAIMKSVNAAREMEVKIGRMCDNIEEIKTALIGGFSTKGLITRTHEIEKRVDDLEEK